ncbi:MAG: hypothetical protein RMJ33_08305 [Saprospiraceae bacterium]|nr:hypothetical protein [Saprospiraceae bacterium]MDW8229825.1 hypothetical protein [Saprospiraceae bacterium]
MHFCPQAFDSIRMHFVNTIAILIPRPFVDAMADRLMLSCWRAYGP